MAKFKKGNFIHMSWSSDIALIYIVDNESRDYLDLKKIGHIRNDQKVTIEPNWNKKTLTYKTGKIEISRGDYKMLGDNIQESKRALIGISFEGRSE